MEKFYYHSNGDTFQKKVVLQIIDNILKINNGEYDAIDKNSNIRNLRIYPVLVVHDRQFESIGLNHLLNNWFQDELNKIKDQLIIKEVNMLIVVNIDKFILYQDSLKVRKVIFENLIDKYSKYSKLESKSASSSKSFQRKIQSALKTFSSFMEDEMDKNGIKGIPSNIKEYLIKLK